VFQVGFRVFRVGFRVFRVGFRMFRVGFRVFRVGFRVFRVGFRVGSGWGSGWVPGGVPAFTDTRYKRLVTKAKVTVLTAKLIVLRGPSLKTFECQDKHVSVDKLIN
jgi:hypothetical protein